MYRAFVQASGFCCVAHFSCNAALSTAKSRLGGKEQPIPNLLRVRAVALIPYFTRACTVNHNFNLALNYKSDKWFCRQ